MKVQRVRIAAKKAFLDMESETRLRRAVSHRNRSNRGGDHTTGMDQVE